MNVVLRAFPVWRPAARTGSNLATHGLGVSSDGSRFFIVQGREQPDSDVIHVMMDGIR